jgi:hypothetical protein
MRQKVQWEQFGPKKFVSKKSVPVRSWRILDDGGVWHRYRISTVWDFGAAKFSSKAAVARLIKDEQKRVGILITGEHGGLVKVGKRIGIFQSIFTAFNTISKKANRSLLSQINCDFFEEGDFVLGREAGDADE